MEFTQSQAGSPIVSAVPAQASSMRRQAMSELVADCAFHALPRRGRGTQRPYDQADRDVAAIAAGRPGFGQGGAGLGQTVYRTKGR
jgi:hypothetical protein